MPFSAFESFVNPLPDERPAPPPGELRRFIWHYVKPFRWLLLASVILAAMIGFIEVMAFDPAVSERTNVRAQLDYVRHSGSSLADLADTLPDLIRHSADEVADWADALVVTQALPAFRTLSVRYGHARIVDLCRLFDTAPSWLSVDGIGW